MDIMGKLASQAIENALKNIPPEVLETIRQAGQIAVSVKAQLDRLEARQLKIMSYLDIPVAAETEPKGLPDGRQSEDRGAGGG